MKTERFETDLASFTIVGGNITNVTFYFDDTAQQWANWKHILIR